MTKEEVKASVTITEVLTQNGIEVKRGRCKGICHDGKDLNVKVSDHLYYCYVCNKAMDIFDVTMNLNHCDFKTALELLGGSEKPSFRATILANTARKERERKMVDEAIKKSAFEHITSMITACRNLIQQNEPFSDIWCECHRLLQYNIYLLEYHDRAGDL